MNIHTHILSHTHRDTHSVLLWCGDSKKHYCRCIIQHTHTLQLNLLASIINTQHKTICVWVCVLQKLNNYLFITHICDKIHSHTYIQSPLQPISVTGQAAGTISSTIKLVSLCVRECVCVCMCEPFLSRFLVFMTEKKKELQRRTEQSTVKPLSEV